MDQDFDEEFFDAISSFHDPIPSPPKSPEFEDIRPPELKSSIHSVIKTNIFLSSLRHREHFPSIKSTPILAKIQSKKKTLEFSNVRLLQEIDLPERQYFNRWIIKFSKDSSYLSITGTGGQIYIYNMSKRSNTYLSSFPEKVLPGHEGKITALSWSKDNKLISSGNDNRVILWEPTKEETSKVFDHPDKVTVCKFYRSNPSYFISTCKDGLLRVFSKEDTNPLGYYQLSMNCYSVDFDLSCKILAVGLDKGEVVFYHIREDFQLRIRNKIACRNKRGVYSKGKKVVGLKFVTHQWLIVTTGDSRIRILMFDTGETIQKFKGHSNFKARITPDYNIKEQTLVSGSENGRIFFWKFDPNIVKNSKFESFEVRSKKCPEFAAMAPLKIEEEVKIRCAEGEVKHVILSIGAKEMLKIFLILAK